MLFHENASDTWYPRIYSTNDPWHVTPGPKMTLNTYSLDAFDVIWSLDTDGETWHVISCTHVRYWTCNPSYTGVPWNMTPWNMGDHWHVIWVNKEHLSMAPSAYAILEAGLPVHRLGLNRGLWSTGDSWNLNTDPSVTLDITPGQQVTLDMWPWSTGDPWLMTTGL
jgi:hypothetical protein